MRDPLTWSMPLARLFGITVRVHVLFPFIALGIILRVAFKDSEPHSWVDATIVIGLLFLAVLLHEFGHCFGARLVDGDAHEILLWPLGGLAAVDVPHTPRAHFITAVSGPLVNLLLCLGTGCALVVVGKAPLPLSPWWDPVHLLPTPDRAALEVFGPWFIPLARFFWVNWVLFLLNVLLPGFPMDGGRLFQCILWPRLGFREATRVAIFAGFVTMLIIGIYAVAMDETLFLLLALFIYVTCRQQYILLETGGEESLFGYDFSQGYTSLERDQPTRRRPGPFKRWLQKRAALKLQREQEIRENEERRMDELLEKVQRDGIGSLSDEERRFLTRVSARYRNRQ